VNAWCVDDSGTRLREGEAGRLVFELQGPRRISSFVGSWALDRPAAGGKPVYRSEDFGSVTRERCLLIESRVQERINLGGNKTTLQQVKREIIQSTGIAADVEVVSVQSEGGFDQVFVFVAGAMKTYLPFLSRLRVTSVPAHLITVKFIDAIPQNEFGKPDVPRLREIAGEAMQSRRFMAVPAELSPPREGS
jgi:non-ribosomal peptide synthetase component E (peptide arylation enzyme)